MARPKTRSRWATCGMCKEGFTRPSYRMKRDKIQFCSRTCAAAYARKRKGEKEMSGEDARVMVKCSHCGGYSFKYKSSFGKKKVFCNRRCYNAYFEEKRANKKPARKVRQKKPWEKWG